MQMRARTSINKSAATCFKAARLCLSVSLHWHTDYMVFYIIHVPLVPLLESTQEQRQKRDMKCEISSDVLQ